jgi:GNAT superfamily N-acetyltransferase
MNIRNDNVTIGEIHDADAIRLHFELCVDEWWAGVRDRLVISPIRRGDVLPQTIGFYVDNGSVGSALVVPHGSTLVVEDLFIKPLMRGQSLGRRALELIEQQARAAGFETIEGKIKGRNWWNLHRLSWFFRSLGFTVSTKKFVRSARVSKQIAHGLCPAPGMFAGRDRHAATQKDEAHNDIIHSGRRSDKKG